jgi:hypothetical protein
LQLDQGAADGSPPLSVIHTDSAPSPDCSQRGGAIPAPERCLGIGEVYRTRNQPSTFHAIPPSIAPAQGKSNRRPNSIGVVGDMAAGPISNPTSIPRSIDAPSPSPSVMLRYLFTRPLYPCTKKPRQSDGGLWRFCLAARKSKRIQRLDRGMQIEICDNPGLSDTGGAVDYAAVAGA